MIRSLPSFLLFLLTLCVPIVAQQGVELHALDGSTAVLPGEIRIQAAASIGANTLVVWGGNRRYGRDSAISNLQAQLVRDTVVQGSPRQIHSDAARPFGFVSVVPFADRYLALWNDRRAGAPGVYMQWIDDDGAPAGGEQLFSTAVVDSTSLLSFGTTSSVLVFRIDRAGSTEKLYLRRFLRDGTPLGAEELVTTGRRLSMERLAGFADQFIVRSDSVRRIFRADGTFESRPIPSGRLEGTWYLGSDSLFITLVDTTLHYHASLFAPMPFRSISMPALRGIDTRTAVLTRESDRVHVTYPGFTMKWEIVMSAIRIVVASNGGISPPDTLDRYSHWPENSAYIEHVGSRPTSVIRRCGNSYDIRLNFWSMRYDGRHRLVSEYAWDWGFRVGEHGEYRREAVTAPLMPCFDIAGILEQHVVVRTSFTDHSTVSITTRFLPRPSSPINAILPESSTLAKDHPRITLITPNPASELARVIVEFEHPRHAIAEIRDMTGRILMREEKSFTRGSEEWDINVSGLLTGMYILAVHGEGGGVGFAKLAIVNR